MRTKLYLLGLILGIMATYLVAFPGDYTLHSPLAPTQAVPESSLDSPPKHLILGFAPYWNMKKISPTALEHITHFAYFNLQLDGDGAVYKRVNRREEDPGYTNYKRLLNGTLNYDDKPLIITFMPLDQDALKSSISSPQNRQATIASIMQVLSESGAMGVNIDYEPLGETPPSLKENFTLFIQELKEASCDKTKDCPLLTISTYASVATRPRIWDLVALAPYTDYFVIMTYDYTLPASKVAGPTSPLRGSGSIFEHDIVKNIAEISSLVPPRQLLLGIPFYGYEWETVDENKYASVEARGSVASLDRVEAMLAENTLELLWDRNSLTPYGVASHSGQISQIYFENETSIRLKLEFVKSAGLGGIAIWALGYEGNTAWLWPSISTLNP